MKRLKRISCLLLTVYCSLLTVSGYSQEKTDEGKALSDYIKNVNWFNMLNPQEKVYLHFDNTGYFLGETIWFKAYVVSATEHQPKPISKVLHVELLSPQGEVLETRKLKIENGACHGEFRLSTDYRSGFYEVRAYTWSMLNFGDDCLFSRVFPIYEEPNREGEYNNPKMSRTWEVKSERESREQKQEINLFFYPEGGHAVVGLPSRIAFKAVNKKGENLDITGQVLNKQGEAVTTISTLHQGMGLFELTPESTQYTVEVEHQGKKQSFPLTGIISSGYSLQVDQPNSESFAVHLQKSPNLSSKTVVVSVSCRGTIYTVGGTTLGEEPYSFSIDKEKLPAGSIQFTLFDSKGNILAERYAFNSAPVEYLRLSAQVEQEKLKPFDRIDIHFSVQDKEGKPVATNFSLAVRDQGSEPQTTYREDLLTYLLLSSELKGYVENPQQYFESNNRATQTKLDLLMMVQAWRRYNWQQMAGVAPFQAKHFAEEGLSLNGRVLWYTQNKPQANADVFIRMSNGEQSFSGATSTDEDGYYSFILSDELLTGKWDLLMQVNKDNKPQHSRILIDRWVDLPKRAFSPDELLASAPVWIEEEIELDSISKRSITEMQQMETVTVSGKKRRRGDNGLLQPDIVLNTERDIAFLQDQGLPYPGTLGEYVDDMSPSIWYVPNWKNPEKIEEGRYAWGGKRAIMWYSDDNWWTAFATGGMDEKFYNVGIESFYKVEIYHTPTAAAEQHIERLIDVPEVILLKAPVAIVASVYPGKLDKYHKGIRQTYFQGYNKPRDFFHIDNSERELGDADFLRTLYWNPNVKTDEEGKVQVTFYNNASCKQITISAEGMHGDGTPMTVSSKQ